DQPDRAPGKRLGQQRGIRRGSRNGCLVAGLRRLPGLGVRPLVVDLADPAIEQVVEFLQAGDPVPGPVVRDAGDLDQELLLDGLEHPLDLPPACRPGWLWTSLMPSTAHGLCSEAPAKQEPLSGV